MMKLGLTSKIEFVKCRFLPGLCHPWHLPGQTRPEDSRTFCGIFVFIIPLNTSKCSNLGTTDFNCSSIQAEMSQHYLESPQTLFSGQVDHSNKCRVIKISLPITILCQGGRMEHRYLHMRQDFLFTQTVCLSQSSFQQEMEGREGGS